jgi:cytoskeletal protein CcmA (bactofilin family)
MRLYLDGVELASQEISGPIAIGEASQAHGVMFSSSGEPLDGLLDEIAIYNRALSASEIQAIYNAGGAGMCRPRKMVCTGIVTITENKEGNVTVSAESTCTIPSDVHIKGYVKVLDGGVLNVKGDITGDVTVSEGTLLVEGSVSGDLEVFGDSQVKVDGGVIDGFVNASSLGVAGAEIYLGPNPSSVDAVTLQGLLILDGPVTVKGNITHIGDGLGVEFRSSNGGSVLVEGSIILHGTGQEVDIASGTGHIVNGNIECDRGGAVDPDDWDGTPGILKGEIIVLESILGLLLIGGGLSAIVIIVVVGYIRFRRKRARKAIL